MAIEAVLFDIGGVLERNAADRLGAAVGERARDVDRGVRPAAGAGGAAGSLGEITLHGAERRIASVFGLDAPRWRRFMDDLWEEYLGTLNEELTAYFASLRWALPDRDRVEQLRRRP